MISQRAMAYLIAVMLFGSLLSGFALSGLGHPMSQWTAFSVLAPLCILSHFYKARGAGHEAWHTNLTFLFAGLLLLPPTLFVMLVIIPHLVEWLKERLARSPSLRSWYIQPFNMATHIIAGFAALCVRAATGAGTALSLSGPSVLASALAAMTYVLLNHVLIGQALVLARRTTWRQSAVLDAQNLLTDAILSLLGYVTAVVWLLNRWLILPALTPLLLIHRTLRIPRLERQAQTDEKTGLWNARHFARLFTAEIDRAGRFGRPVGLVMADLDLLRNINNTYGHLAGDQVLARIGRIIRETTREYDIAARFGGEEFTIMLPETGPMEAQSYAERLRQTVEAAEFEVTTSPTAIHATMSLGIACFPTDATTPASLIHEADVAVYQAKLRGRNCVVSAPEVVDSVELEGMLLEDRLRAPYAASYDAWPV